MPFVPNQKSNQPRKIQNLKSLITCKMELKTVAQMSDLEDAIMESSLAPKTQR